MGGERLRGLLLIPGTTGKTTAARVGGPFDPPPRKPKGGGTLRNKTANPQTWRQNGTLPPLGNASLGNPNMGVGHGRR